MRPLLFYRYYNLRGERVLGGVFAGMRYVERPVNSAWFPKVLGTYELEIAGWIRELIASRPHTVAVVGAGEGYYAVGLACALPASSRIVAFEADPSGPGAIAELARRNGVERRLAVRGACRPVDLAEVLERPGPAQVLMDVEGGEIELLDPLRVPALGRAAILVELHPWVVPDVEEQLRERFAGTHRIEQARPDARHASQIPSLTLRLLAALRRGYAGHWLDEARPASCSWLRLTPHPASDR